MEDQYSVLIRFNDQSSTDSFFKHFRGKRFSSLEVDACQVLYTLDVEYTGSIEHAQGTLASSAEQVNCALDSWEATNLAAWREKSRFLKAWAVVLAVEMDREAGWSNLVVGCLLWTTARGRKRRIKPWRLHDRTRWSVLGRLVEKDWCFEAPREEPTVETV
ncbi:BRCA1-associated protein [Dendrobium catenatum]|uniref:BRCA1-associated protein n=1 Tax=Dendrobium catenatum TaxID=906689 RepID=A0A2I0XBX2_9ASPA|nr:BRCA1-associated protein [Dendrobium catenatum]